MNMNSQSNDISTSNMFIKNTLVVGGQTTIGNNLVSNSIVSDSITTNVASIQEGLSFTQSNLKNGVLISDANGEVSAVAGPPFIGSSGQQPEPQPFPFATTTQIGSSSYPFVTTVNTYNAFNPETGVYTCPVSGKYRFYIYGRFNTQAYSPTPSFLLLEINNRSQSLDNYNQFSASTQIAHLIGEIILDCPKDSTHFFSVRNTSPDVDVFGLFFVNIQFVGI
jgi:hypothetical protein